MLRQVRIGIEYRGAIYSGMNRGDHREPGRSVEGGRLGESIKRPLAD